jgi:exosortase/archaeosortase family protein
MLWAGLYLCFTLAAFQRLDGFRTAVLGVLAVAAVLAANVLRATALFYVEADLVKLPPEGHAGIGIVVFLLAALAMAHAARQLKKPAHADC